MKTQEIKTATGALSELTESCSDVSVVLRDTGCAVDAAKKLWRANNKSKLTRIGVALIMFPEPTQISDCIGACLVVAGTVQKGIRNRALFLEDVPSALKNTLKDVWAIRNST